MVQVLEGKGSVIGRIGKGFAEGLAEQVPKEIERYRLSSGLKKLEGQNLTPIQQYSTLIQSGATPDQVAQILPLLERAQSNAEAKRFAEEGRKAQAATGAATGQRAITPQGQPQAVQVNAQGQPVPSRNQLITAEGEQARLNPILPLSVEELRAQGADLHAKFPNLYPTQQAGEAEADRINKTNIERQKTLIKKSDEQKSIRTELDKQINDRLKTELQKEGFEILGETTGGYYKQIADEADAEVASGAKTTQQAAEDASQKLKNYANLRLANRKIGQKSLLSKNPKAVRSQLKSQREAYEKIGQLDTFYNDLITNHNLTPLKASYLTYPITDHKELNNWLAKTKKVAGAVVPGQVIPKADQVARKKANQLSQYLGVNDSLLAIAAELQGKNIDADAFLDEVSKLRRTGKITLSEKQGKELENAGSTNGSIGDLFLFAMGGVGSLPRME